MAFRSAFVAGSTAGASLLPPVFTVGVVAGIAATEAGVPPLQTVGMGVLFFSPVSTVTTIGLLDAGASAVVIVLTALSVVVHFSVLSLSIAPYFERVSTGWRWVLAYFLNTPNYALSVDRYEVDPATDVRGFYLGVGIPLWLTWQTAIVGGIVFGVTVPAGWELDFVVPLVFIALLINMVRRRTTAAVAVVAGVVSVASSGMPLNAGVLVAALVGTVTGVVLQHTGWPA